MVRLSIILNRIPVIKFRKGGASHVGTSSPGASGPTAAATAGTPVQSQPAAAMSTGAIPDIDLPARYKRQPLSEEEIAYINGGGIV